MDIPNGIKLRHLEAFLAVTEVGTISAAARARHVSQPALSKTISELETALSAQLFERSGRRTVLTPAGESFRRHAMAALQTLEAGCRMAAQPVRSDLVKIGVLPTVAGSFFPSAALAFSKMHPDVRVGVMTGPNRYLIDMVRSGRIDLMVGRMPPADLMPGLSFEYLFEEPIELVARADHPARSGDLTQALSRYPLILPNPGAIIRRNVDQYLAALGLSGVQPAFETVALPVALSLLENSDMLWFISRGVVERELASGQLLALDMKAGYMSGAVGLTRKHVFDGKTPAGLFAETLHRYAKELMPRG